MLETRELIADFDAEPQTGRRTASLIPHRNATFTPSTSDTIADGRRKNLARQGFHDFRRDPVANDQPAAHRTWGA
jgi:hypothetical protein